MLSGVAGDQTVTVQEGKGIVGYRAYGKASKSARLANATLRTSSVP
jgi:hypothetical protein